MSKTSAKATWGRHMKSGHNGIENHHDDTLAGFRLVIETAATRLLIFHTELGGLYGKTSC
jgi:hypothetical protein